MVYTQFVQLGRVVFIAKGKYAGKIATIVNVVDGNRVMIDGPTSGVPRSVRNMKDIQLTKFVTKARVGQRTGPLKKALEADKINEKWAETTWAKKLAAKAKRQTLNDFDRYKLMRAKQARNKIVRAEFNKLRKAANKAKAK
ncbi:hypothetical protein WR25_07571 [Diploscapter pachys]|uniref:Large ribosomal subunit protein eL14 n=1 Tax=Diploscapter pachys TaxID=2018661 RepID=A0A2A2LQL6_9BILA|nr:hypothetical protein WR25_07571 [Diploscapter pachys]